MDGIINVYKERGWTSFDVTKKLRSVLKEKKIGHTGTLDPDAEGVLIVCAGKATKLVNSITASEKVYEAEITLGLSTDTEDISGTVLERRPVNVTEKAFRQAILSFIGQYDQIPPMYSAKKVNGQKLYDLARKGKTVERKPNRVTIKAIEIKEISLPRAVFTVTCSKGTYIRTLCKDIGDKLGTGAVMSSLKRLRVGKFDVRDSHTITEIEALAAENRLYEIMLPAIYIPEKTVLTFGKFDGGHLGHQVIFENVFRIAEEKHLKTAVLTFTQNPDVVVKGINRPGISTEQEHVTRLRNYGFDYVFEFPMTKETMRVPAEDFLKTTLVRAMNASDIVVGTDCSFGYKAEGNAALLTRLQDTYGYTVHVIPKKQVLDEHGDYREISSTFIKEEITRGNVKRAHELLGRYFSISGAVQHGKQIGSTALGFPTANILPPEGKTLPADGVYVTRVLIDQKLYRGMTNVGTNPTVAEGNPVDIETYVLDFSGDLYHKKIRVDFVDRIRDQRKFDSLEALKQQLKLDMEVARNYPIPEPAGISKEPDKDFS
jgi:tRNA pseudouridine(55) synthase/riboflavin kinase/FMN adenylyltransferase